ncbi:MAG: BrnT family toxin [Lawsonibacter sp.]|nr:BrnT family toxin [Lawsonibacter sp.]
MLPGSRGGTGNRPHKSWYTVFYDDEALVRDDPDHSAEEERFVILGLSSKANLPVVCHCYRVSETVIRIISARKATRTESKYYRK